MKKSKAVNVTKTDLEPYNRTFELYTSKIVPREDYEVYKDFSCQYDHKTNVICTCRRTKRYYVSHDVFRAEERYPGWKSFTEIGVGSIKYIPKRRTRRVYLPETRDTGIGSSDILIAEKRRRCDYSYYEQKKTSSKCVGGIIDTINAPVVSKKLSPIIQTKSCTTSPINLALSTARNTESVKSLRNSKMLKTDKEANLKMAEREDIEESKNNNSLSKKIVKEEMQKKDTVIEQAKIKPLVQQLTIDKDYSSDSLVQHVHNLENPSYDKQSKMSLDLIENKMEREYRKMFVTEKKESLHKANLDKQSSDLKRASLLRRRFESLRKGLCKKDDSPKETVVPKTSSRKSVHSRRDVSIASDPPSLEAKSYSNTKIYSPYTSFSHPQKANNPTVSIKMSPDKKQGPGTNWSTDIVDDCQSVRGMFKLWGKKFNFEEESNKKSNLYKGDIPEKVVEIIVPEKNSKSKKGGKKFFFFNKRSKDKSKPIFKKGVTAGRCEVEDRLTVNIGPKDYENPVPEVLHSTELDICESITRKSWLRKFLTTKVDSRRSVKIRWNNNLYSTSSSTIMELLDCVYKNTGIVIGSKSEISTCDSSNYYANIMKNPPNVNFMPQSIEAWMIPTTVVNSPYQAVQVIKSNNNKTDKSKNIEVTYLDRKWYIDKSHRRNTIELVIDSKNLIQTTESKSSDYIEIDIPKGYFSDSTETNNHQTSDEEVYKITDYESPSSKQSMDKRTGLDTGDHISICVETKNSENKEIVELERKESAVKNSSLQRDVIGVGIITQRDIRDIKNPVLKVQDDTTDSESAQKLPPPKKCEFAESYLQDYCRNWIPLGIDFYSWCVSDTQLRSSENSHSSLNNQGDVSKSCPTIIDDYQSTIISSCETSSCSHCHAVEQENQTKESKNNSIFNKIFSKTFDTSPEPKTALVEGKRLMPKDSLEVFKRRKIYCEGYNAKWNALYPKPCPMPSIGDVQPDYSRKSKKHVSIPECEPYDVLEQPCDKCFPGILTYKSSNNCKKKAKPKHTSVNPDPVCAIPPKPLCSNLCSKECAPPCALDKGKKNKPCSGRIPPVCNKCSPLQPCEIAKFLENNPHCPSMPQKCQNCFSIILPQKCAKCYSPILPLNCLVCSTPVIPLKCVKCNLPVVPQKCSQCPSPPSTHICPKCSIPVLLSKCPKCSILIIPQKCLTCHLLIIPANCPNCFTVVSPPKCPKCSIQILPTTCPNCPSSPTTQMCPKCSIAVVLPKCPKCLIVIRPQKCPQCSLPIIPPKCPKCSMTVLPPKCPKCFVQILPNKCPNCSLSSVLQKCPTCSTPALPHKCPQCYSLIIPQPCSKCKTLILPSKCTKCSLPIIPQKCPKCSSVIIPLICPKCSSPPPQKCPKSSSPIGLRKCPNCSITTILPKCPNGCSTITPIKCPKCCFSLLPPKCPTCCAPIPPPKCPKCSKEVLPQKCPNCNSRSSTKCPKSCSPIVIKSPQSSPECSARSSPRKCRECSSQYSATARCSPPPSPPRSPCISPRQSSSNTRRKPSDMAPKGSRYKPCSRCNSPPKCQQAQTTGIKIQKTVNKCRNQCHPCPSKNVPTKSRSRDSLIGVRSKDNIRINFRKQTPSTEEIREGYNIKVQDEDGQTLYERIDYRKPSNRREPRIYQNKICGESYIHRVSTPSIVLNKVALNETNFEPKRSATSIGNLVEINLTLKIKQGDKTEVNICNQGDVQKSKETNNIQSQELFHVQEQVKDNDNVDKNDVNIKILIRNFSTNDECKIKRTDITNTVTTENEEFSKKISDKFQTVSTGYSEFILDQSSYPVQTSTLDEAHSAQIITKNKKKSAEEVKRPENYNYPKSSVSLAERTATDNTLKSYKSKFESKTDVSDKSKDSFNFLAEKSDTCLSLTEQERVFENYLDRENIIQLRKLRNIKDKKEMLKKLCEEASTIDSKNKGKVKALKEKLRAILTSDSSGTEDNSDSAANFDLIKDLPRHSKPSCRKSESLSNLYNLDTTILDENCDDTYLTKDDSSESSEDTETDTDKSHHCMCSALAARMKTNGPKITPCCCKGCDKQDEGIHCDIKTTKQCVNVQTQDSKFGKPYLDEAIKVNRHRTLNGPKPRSCYACVKKKIHQQILLNLPDEEAVVYYLCKKSNEISFHSCHCEQNADILQSEETKKAVLEIYAEKSITEEGTRFVAKLPKFAVLGE